MKRTVLAALVVALLISLSPGVQAADEVWQHPETPVEKVIVTTLGDAPLLGEVKTKAALMEAATSHEARLREALQIMGHSGDVADRVVEALQGGHVTQTVLPNGVVLDTFGWYGITYGRAEGVVVFGRTELRTGHDLDAWQLVVRVESKEIRFVLPFACGNLARWGYRCDLVTRVRDLPPPLPPTKQRPRPRRAPAVTRAPLDKGNEVALGSTSSSLALYPVIPETRVSQTVNVPQRRAGTVTITGQLNAAAAGSGTGSGAAATSGGGAAAGAGNGAGSGAGEAGGSWTAVVNF